MCFPHNWEYVGWVNAVKWWGGVSGGIPVDVKIQAKQCTKCGKTKEVV